MVPLQDLYDAFLARIASDEWVLPEDLELAQEDWFQLFKIASFRFKFPRVSLDVDDTDTYFTDDVTNDEIQVLATYMKHEWIKRCIASWEEIKMLYSNKDFSQANHLDKLIKLGDQVASECVKMNGTYSRSINHTPYNYGIFAGGSKNV